ncbi:hypothetical protein WA577_004869, partial [Blastocystis sp. JDR]
MSVSGNVQTVVKSIGVPDNCLDDDVCWKFNEEANTVTTVGENGELLEKEADVYDHVIDCGASNTDLYQRCFSGVGQSVVNGIRCYLIGEGETSCDITTLFQGSEGS